MIRQVIQIDKEKCNGCGICANACHEGAIGMVNGKAVLLKDDYCDGMGDCLPSCPMNAISFIQREAAAYDEAAVQAHKEKKAVVAGQKTAILGDVRPSQLQNWPVQIKLAPMTAPYYQGADLLIAADCTAYAYADFHRDFMEGKMTLIGCPKLDQVDYSQKLAAIFINNSIHSCTVVRMQVPCCGGLEMAVRKAISASGKRIELKVITITNRGSIL